MKKLISALDNFRLWLWKFAPIIFTVAWLAFMGGMIYYGIVSQSSRKRQCQMVCGTHSVLVCQEQIHENKDILLTLCGNDSVHRTEIKDD